MGCAPSNARTMHTIYKLGWPCTANQPSHKRIRLCVGVMYCGPWPVLRVYVLNTHSLARNHAELAFKHSLSDGRAAKLRCRRCWGINGVWIGQTAQGDLQQHRRVPACLYMVFGILWGLSYLHTWRNYGNGRGCPPRLRLQGCLALAVCYVYNRVCALSLCLHHKKFAPDGTSSGALSPLLSVPSVTFFYPKLCLHFAYYKMRPVVAF